jgi:hypothetical protein
MRVVAADKGGTIRESLAMGKVYAAAREKQGESELLDELVASPPAIDRGQVEAAGDLAAATRQGLQDAMRLMEEKATPEEVDAYKHFVMSVAQAAASAHKEGGFLGIGGKEVSEAEDQALDEISTTLGEPPAA